MFRPLGVMFRSSLRTYYLHHFFAVLFSICIIVVFSDWIYLTISLSHTTGMTYLRIKNFSRCTVIWTSKNFWLLISSLFYNLTRIVTKTKRLLTVEWSWHATNIFVFLLVSPWRWSHKWPKHVRGHYATILHITLTKDKCICWAYLTNPMHVLPTSQIVIHNTTQFSSNKKPLDESNKISERKKLLKITSSVRSVPRRKEGNR